ncbi:GMP synthase [Heracleum sosnowskyi]|uniref:GMP synthase n=1 Tax=Heracleum sosnowskyi TaxID=360622 RepID=A0AAD8N3V1_9APIA|nr:GMP synthase [Heracleum sosnowskyi]
MSVANELLVPETRTILGPAGNRVSVSEHETKGKKEKTPEKPKKLSSVKPEPVRDNVVRSKSTVKISSAGVTVLSSASCVKKNPRKDKKSECQSTLSNVAAGSKIVKQPSVANVPLKQCDWITSFSDPVYISFHDQEWGVPVRDDRKLFELFVLSIALAEMTWPDILYKRDTFRKHFDNFDPCSVAKFSEEKLLSMKANCSTLLSEPKLRAVVENANQLLKVQEEFGSFSNYCWRFLNHKQIQNGIRYARQVPVKTPKSEAISKDLMRRGFRCVGPTVVYSFMQVSGMTNDHLVTCFRYHECKDNAELQLKPKILENKVSAELMSLYTN